MARRKKSAQPRDLVRLSPKQFSAAVAFIVLLAGAALLTGYILGVRSAGKGPPGPVFPVKNHEEGKGETTVKPGDSRSKAENGTTITFYSALTKKKTDGKKPAATAGEKKPSPGPAHAPRSAGKENKPVAGGVVIQAGSYKDRLKADEFLKGLTDSGYSGSVVRAELGPRGVWYRVRLGPYGSVRDAEQALATLKEKMAIKGFLVKPGT